jgi:hypothetical protein
MAAARLRSAAPQRRVILLGASNLTKGIGTVIETAKRIWNEPLDVQTALGHGRSYGRNTRVMGIGLPGIAHCGLWQSLTSAGRLPTAALVTDIGNDLLYEEPVGRIVGWLEACLDRLAAAEATITITRLPVANVQRLSPAKFKLMRSVLYPYSRITLAEITRRAIALDEQVARLAQERSLTVLTHRPEWYSFDPIHIRFTRRAEAWRDILGAWTATGGSLPPGGNALLRTLHVRTRTPHSRRLLFVSQRRAQPTARFRDGSLLSIY